MATSLEENLFLCCQVSMASLRILGCLQLLRGLFVQEEKNESELPAQPTRWYKHLTFILCLTSETIKEWFLKANVLRNQSW